MGVAKLYTEISCFILFLCISYFFIPSGDEFEIIKDWRKMKKYAGRLVIFKVTKGSDDPKFCTYLECHMGLKINIGYISRFYFPCQGFDVRSFKLEYGYPIDPFRHKDSVGGNVALVDSALRDGDFGVRFPREDEFNRYYELALKDNHVFNYHTTEETIELFLNELKR